MMSLMSVTDVIVPKVIQARSLPGADFVREEVSVSNVLQVHKAHQVSDPLCETGRILLTSKSLGGLT